MAQDKVAVALSRVLKRNPKATNEQLRKAAERVNTSIKKVSGRVFHAKYAMPAKRAAGLVRKPGKRTRTSPGRKRAKRRVKMNADSLSAARELVLERDRQVIQTLRGRDAQAGYELAASLDSYIEELAQTLKR